MHSGQGCRTKRQVWGIQQQRQVLLLGGKLETVVSSAPAAQYPVCMLQAHSNLHDLFKEPGHP